jgi:ABC-type microcin C transport system permease subunit YejE
MSEPRTTPYVIAITIAAVLIGAVLAARFAFFAWMAELTKGGDIEIDDPRLHLLINIANLAASYWWLLAALIVVTCLGVATAFDRR